MPNAPPRVRFLNQKPRACDAVERLGLVNLPLRDRATVEVFAENGSAYCVEGRKHLGTPLKDFTISIDGVSAK